MASLLTVSDVCSIMNLHRNTVYRWKKQGKIPFTMVNGEIRFNNKDLEDWLNNGSFKSLQKESLLPKLFLSLEMYDRMFLKGDGTLGKKSSKYWSYKGIGAVYIKSTKSGEDRWYMWYYDANGQRKQKHIKGATCRQDAVMSLVNAVNEVRQKKFYGENVKKRATFKKFAEVYLEDYAKLKKRSWKSDQKYLNSQLIPFFGKMRLSDISSFDVQEFRRKRLQDGVKGSTINKETTVLKKMLSLAKEWGYEIEKNPVDKGNFFPEEDYRRTRVLTCEEEKRLLSNSAPHLRPMILCALYEGFRLKEIINLRVADVDLEMEVLRIRAENNKTGKVDLIPIVPKMEKVFRKLIAENGGRSEYVFNYLDPKSGKFRPVCSIQHAFEAARRRANIKGLQFRDLRRTCGTRLHERGVDPLIIQRLLRHSSFKISEEVYIQSNLKQIRSALEKLEEKPVARRENSEELLPICYSENKGRRIFPVTAFISMN